MIGSQDPPIIPPLNQSITPRIFRTNEISIIGGNAENSGVGEQICEIRDDCHSVSHISLHVTVSKIAVEVEER